jgi:hypothetical protein
MKTCVLGCDWVGNPEPDRRPLNNVMQTPTLASFAKIKGQILAKAPQLLRYAYIS